jgi:hypothetical protein
MMPPVSRVPRSGPKTNQGPPGGFDGLLILEQIQINDNHTIRQTAFL